MNDKFGELSHEMAEDIRKTMHRKIGDPFGEADDGPIIIRFETYAPYCLVSAKPKWAWQNGGELWEDIGGVAVLSLRRLPPEPPSRYVHEVRGGTCKQ